MNTNLLAKLLVNTNDLNNMKLLLKAIFTSKELKEFDNRLKIFQLLMQGKKHREISENLNVGIATVTRGSLAFDKEEIFKMKTNIINILRQKKLIMTSKKNKKN